MKSRLFVLPAALAVLALVSGCGNTECSSGSVYSEGPNAGQCASKEAVQQNEAHEKHENEVKEEAHEVEGVLKKRQAEETAGSIEEAAK